MTATMPALGWIETFVMVGFVVACVVGICLYHRWLDRRLARERAPREEQPSQAPRAVAVKARR